MKLLRVGLLMSGITAILFAAGCEGGQAVPAPIAAVALAIFTGFGGATNKTKLNLTIHNAGDGELLWKYNQNKLIYVMKKIKFIIVFKISFTNIIIFIN